MMGFSFYSFNLRIMKLVGIWGWRDIYTYITLDCLGHTLFSLLFQGVRNNHCMFLSII